MRTTKKLLSFILALLLLGSTVSYADVGVDEAVEDNVEAALVVITEASAVPAETETEASEESAETEAEASTETEESEAEALAEAETEAPAEIEAASSEETKTEAPAETETAASEETKTEAPAETETAASEDAKTAVSEEIKAEASEEEVENGGASTVSTAVGTLSKKNIQIDSDSIIISKVQTNTNYSSLSFSFTCEEDATVYDAFITGLGIYYQAEQNFDYVVAMVRDIADSFYAGESMTLSDSTAFADKYKLTVRAIDAEKVHDTGSTPYTDTNLCWAATASDMLQFTGWANAADAEKFKNEDDVFAYFEKAYTDAGSSQERGTKWFFNGVNVKQNVDENGNIIYGGTSGSSQEREYTGTKSGGLLPDYAEESFERSYLVSESGIDSLYDAAMGLKDGKAVGLGVYFYNANNEYTGDGHAITLFGFIKNAVEEGVNSLKSLFIADSDNNKFNNADRSQIVDSVTMYQLGDWTGKSGGKEVTSKAILNFSGSNVPILDYTTLDPCSGAEALKETKGTKDAVNSIDFTPVYIAVEDSEENKILNAKVGETWKLSAGIKNISYSSVKTPNGEKPYLRGKFTVTHDGQSTEIPIAAYMNDVGCNPLKGSYFTKDYKFIEAGTYTVDFTLDGIYFEDASGEVYRINEAYYNNNDSRTTYTLTVNPLVSDNDMNNYLFDESMYEDIPEYEIDFNYPESAGDASPEDSEINEAVPGSEADFNYSESKTVYSVKVVLPSVGSYSIVMDGKLLDASAYTIVKNSDGSFTVSFSPEFIKSLAPGSCKLNIRNESGRTVAILMLTVR